MTIQTLTATGSTNLSVAEYWLVDPKLRGVEVYTLSNGEYALFGQYTGNDLIESSVLVGLQIKADNLFQSLLGQSSKQILD